MNKIESEARYEIEMEAYVLHIQIESRVMGDLARNHIVPTAVGYQNVLIKNVMGLKSPVGMLVAVVLATVFIIAFCFRR